MSRHSSPPFKARPVESTPSLSDILSALRPRRTEVPVEDDTSGCAPTFGDFVLLLLCFFVLWHIPEKQQLLAQIELADQTKPLVQTDLAAKEVEQASSANFTKLVELPKLAKQAERTASALPLVHLPSLVPQPELVSIQPPVRPALLTSADIQEDTHRKALQPLQPVPILVPLAPEVATPTVDQS